VIRARTDRAAPSARLESTPIADELRLKAIAFKADGKDEYAAGLAHAADIVDAKAHLLRGVAFVDALDRMIEARLEAFVGDVVASVRDAGPSSPPPPIDLPPLSIRPKPRKVPRRSELSPAAAAPIAVHPATVVSREARELAAGGLNRGPLRCLIVIAQHAPAAVSREQLSTITGYARRTRDDYLQALTLGHYAVRAEGGFLATDKGRAALPADFEPLPTGRALLHHWIAKLPQGPARVLEYVAKFYPHPVDRTRVGEALSYARRTRDDYLQNLIRRRLVDKTGAGHVVASDLLFDPAAAAVAIGSR
jgi:hypothetical protein